jgi:isopentenyl diphosphate isomerase/L-lactate dehydrogenase-like FMN-dependent dehydrogenase
MESGGKLADRRAVLRYLATSSALAYAGTASGLFEWFAQVSAQGPVPRGLMTPRENRLAPPDEVVITSVKEALTIMDFYNVARAKFPPLHHFWYTNNYYNETVRANVEGFTKYQLRRRQLTGISSIDLSIDLFGKKYPSPIYLCPGGGNNLMHPGVEGNIALAMAAKTRGSLLIRGGGNLDKVNAARGEPVWGNLQGPTALDPKNIQRFLDAGTPVLTWTVDNMGGGNMPGSYWFQRMGVKDLNREGHFPCSGCHQPPARARVKLDDPMSVIGAVGAVSITPPFPTWDDIKRVRDMTKSMKLVLKGIVTREDAALAVKHGVDGVIVSTHGGHEDQGGRGAIEALPEVVQEVGGKIPVLFDSGVRSGVDVFKAFALGATAVGVGRAHHWGLGAFGQEGVEAAVRILERELQAAMAQTNCPSIKKIRRDTLAVRDWTAPPTM